jgi:hypothetical protein
MSHAYKNPVDYQSDRAAAGPGVPDEQGQRKAARASGSYSAAGDQPCNGDNSSGQRASRDFDTGKKADGATAGDCYAA